LQAACLALLIKQRSNCSVKIIDYPPLPSDRPDIGWLKSVKGNLQQVGTPRLDYLRSCVDLTRQLLFMNVRHLSKAIARENISCIVCGSDTIWDVKNREFSRTRFNPGFADWPSLLPSVPYAYFAGSADPTFSFEHAPHAKAPLAAALPGARFCGYRDERTKDMLSSLVTASTALHYTPDPTLLAWPQDLIPPVQTETGGPIGIQVADANLRDAIMCELSSAGVAFVDVLQAPIFNPVRNTGADGFRRALFARLELGALVTDRFHGAIIFTQMNRHQKKPLVLIEHAAKWISGTGKLFDLGKRLNAEDLVISVKTHGDSDAVRAIVTRVLSPGGHTSSHIFERVQALAETSRPAVDTFLNAVA